MGDPTQRKAHIKDVVDFFDDLDHGQLPAVSYLKPDSFVDGPRIPFIAVSKYSRGGNVVHSYTDHASVVKFIERNWHLKPLTNRRPR